MPTRITDENIVEHRQHGAASAGVRKRVAAIDVKGVSQLRPLNATRKPTAVTSKTTKPGEDGKGKPAGSQTHLAPRQALASLTRNNPAQSRTSSTSSSKTTAKNPIVSHTASSQSKLSSKVKVGHAVASRRPVQAKEAKSSTLTIYTPAKPALQPAADEEDYDEIEYMPPTAIQTPYEPPTPMRFGGHDDDFTFTARYEPTEFLPNAIPDDSRNLMTARQSPMRHPGDDSLGSDFGFDG